MKLLKVKSENERKLGQVNWGKYGTCVHVSQCDISQIGT